MKVTVSVQKRGATSWRIRTRWKEGNDWQEISETMRGTQREAEAHKELILSEFAAGRRSKLSFDTVPVYLKRWVEYRLAVGAIKPNTANHYRMMLQPVVEHFSDTRLAGLTPDRCREFVHDDVLRKGVKNANHRFVIFKAAMANAVKEGLIPQNPIDQIEAPRVPAQRQKTTLTDEQMQALHAASRSQGRIGLAVRIALATGMRRGEIVGLQWRHVNGNVIHVEQNAVRVGHKVHIGTPKTVASIRDVTIPPELVADLQGWRGQPNEYVLTGTDQPHCPNDVLVQTKRLMREVGVDGMSFHDLRHAHATTLLRKGVPIKVVSTRLGHSKIATTLDTYTHVLPKDDDAVMNALNEALGPSRPRLVQ